MDADQRLFWADAYLRVFDARVVAESVVDGRPAVELDRTAFYATSGGQPHDLGQLNGTAVLGVQERDGRLLHVMAGAVDGPAVHGQIDWPRRFDHMQQHTGQHILSAACEQALEAHTVSFHLGELTCTVDLDRADLDGATAQRIEALANQIVFENRVVAAQEHSPEQALALPLRKAPPAHERIRIVSIDGFDLCACGGTHVRATGEVGLIHIRRCERRKSETRVEFLCGWRAQRDYGQRDALLQGAAQSLSVGVDELSEAALRLERGAQEARREAEHLRSRLLDLELPAILAQGEDHGTWRLVCQQLAGYDVANMRCLAQRLASTPGVVALLAVTQPSPQLAFARSDELPFDMGRLLRDAAAPFGGRGGGRPNTAQGGGVSAEELSAVLARARELLAQATR